MAKEMIVLLGAGKMGPAIIRRIANGKKVVLGDLNSEILETAKEELLDAGFDVDTRIVDDSNRRSITEFAEYAASFDRVSRYIHIAGVSPNMARPEDIIRVNLIGTAIILEVFHGYIGNGGADLVISNQASHTIPLAADFEEQLAQVPADELSDLTEIKTVDNSGYAYGTAKHVNIVRVQHETVLWGDKGARINTVSPGTIITPLARHELQVQPESYARMIRASATGRTGTPDEVAQTEEFLLSDDSNFITGADLLVDGGVVAVIKAGHHQLGM